jgi:hypothetical protein
MEQVDRCKFPGLDVFEDCRKCGCCHEAMIRKPVKSDKSDKLEKPGKLVKEVDVFLVSSGI